MNYDKIVKVLGQDTVNELDGLDKEALHKTIVDAEQAMKTVKDELEANPEYQRLKDGLAAVTEGKKAVDKRQKAKISYVLSVLTSRG